MIHKDFLYNTALGVSELSQQLRHKGVEHLGQVAQAFVEADGVLTVYRAREERPGLPIVPPWEIVAPAKVRADEAAASRATLSVTAAAPRAMLTSAALPVSATIVTTTCGHPLGLIRHIEATRQTKQAVAGREMTR